MILSAVRINARTLFGRGVTAVRGGDQSHCEIAVHGPDGSWCVSAAALDGGVRGKMIDLRNPIEWRVYRMPEDSVIPPGEWLKDHEGYGYDYVYLAGFFVRRWKGSKSRYGCGEACAEMLRVPEPFLYDPRMVEGLTQRLGGVPVFWIGGQWVEAKWSSASPSPAHTES